MSKLIDNIRRLSAMIKNETRSGGNTAARVGGLFEEIADELDMKSDSTEVEKMNREHDGNPLAHAAIRESVRQATERLDREKLDKTGDGKEVTVTFSEAAARVNVNSGEKLSVLFGKVLRWLGDLRALAFKDKVAKDDLEAGLQTEIDGKLPKGEIVKVYKSLEANHAYVRSEDATSNVAKMYIGTCYGYNTPVDAMEVTNGNVNALGVLSVKDNKVWHAGNDGSGSGLDADMLDGKQGSDYFSVLTATSGVPDDMNLSGVRTLIKSLPDGLADVYNYGVLASFCGSGYGKLQLYAPHAQDGKPSLFIRTGYAANIMPWLRIVTTDMIPTSFVEVTEIANQNLNDLNGFGMMTVPLNLHATEENNFPIDQAGVLIYATAAYNSASQIYSSFNDNRWFVRSGGIGPTEKTPWKEIAMKDMIPTSLPASGGNADTVDGKHAAEFLGNSGNQTINGDLSLNTLSQSCVKFFRNGVYKAYVGCGDMGTTDVYLYNVVSNAHVRAADNGKCYANGKEIATVDQLAGDQGGVGDRDWNTIVTPGNYLVSATGWGTNGPSEVYQYGVLTVATAGTAVTQTYCESNEGTIYYRVRYNESGGFGAWITIAKKSAIPKTTADLPDSANKRYVTDAEKEKMTNSLKVICAGVVKANGMVLRSVGSFQATNSGTNRVSIDHGWGQSDNYIIMAMDNVGKTAIIDIVNNVTFTIVFVSSAANTRFVMYEI